MIPRSDNSCQGEHLSAGQSWQQILSDSVTTITELAHLLQLDVAALKCATDHRFPLLAPRPYVSRIVPGDPLDPLLLQILPQAQEQEIVPGYATDPMQEGSAIPLKGMIRKYQGRVLLMLSAACGVNCRYCFRRHFPYQEQIPARAEWQQILDYIRADPTISEVILSGGDPLVISDQRLGLLLQGLQGIGHLQRLRIHTRMPVVIPQRICESLLTILSDCHLQKVLVIHCNHPRELDADVRHALAALARCGVSLLNQSVLLKGVNDSAATIIALSEALFAAGVQPYYLHMLDRVAGSAHFEVDEERVKDIHREVESALAGYLLPRFVREIPGASSKVSVANTPRIESGIVNQ